MPDDPSRAILERLAHRSRLLFLSALLVQVTTILTMTPAMTLFAWAASADIQRVVSSWPFVVQFIAILFLTDFVQHWVHRAFHRVPILWRFHRIHHSADVMDWLAGSRLHLVDVAVTRGLTYVPIYLLGFAEPPLYAYVAFVSVQATFIHANVRFGLVPALGAGHAAVPPLAPRRGARGRGQELRSAPAAAGSPVRDLLPPRGPMAHLGWSGRWRDRSAGYVRQLVDPFVSGYDPAQLLIRTPTLIPDS